MNKPPAYQHYAKEWLEGTAHLSLEEQGAYQRLLDHEWERGPLNPDMGELANLLGVSRQRFAKLWAKLRRYFPAQADGHLANPKLEQIRAAQEAYRQRQSERGRAGGQTSAQARGQASAQARGQASAQPALKPQGKPEASSPTSYLLKSTTTIPSESGKPVQEARAESIHAVILPLLREHVWRPDGKCPSEINGAPWDERREGTVIRELAKSYSVSELEVITMGLGYMVRGLAETERPEWLAVGSKPSLRAVYRSRSGVVQMAEACKRAYWLVENRKPRKPRAGPESITVRLPELA
ncbi:MAG TPA: DUF1376 domain-containing protein [Gemmatimonadales bacterium]|nr:DUF1376 domain-containing protein [Gemmatimonadales bacterium]